MTDRDIRAYVTDRDIRAYIEHVYQSCNAQARAAAAERGNPWTGPSGAAWTLADCSRAWVAAKRRTLFAQYGLVDTPDGWFRLSRCVWCRAPFGSEAHDCPGLVIDPGARVERGE